MSYKSENEEYIRGITKVEFVNEKTCSRQKEIGEIYVSKIDRAGHGMPPAGIDNDKSNKLYFGYDYTPRLENKFFFYKGDVPLFIHLKKMWLHLRNLAFVHLMINQ